MSDRSEATRKIRSGPSRNMAARALLFISPIVIGLALALALSGVAPRLVSSPNYNQILAFAAGAAAAVLVLRLIVQRERRVALQLVMSEIVGENTSPEIAAMRILEALCVSQGWDVALRWEICLLYTSRCV